MTRKRIREISKAKCDHPECKRGKDVWYGTECEFGAGVGIWKKKNQALVVARASS